MKSETLFRHIGALVLLLILLFVGSNIRLQGVANIPTGQFASNDAFMYYTQAETIIAEGTLPAVDGRRWVPLGRDLRQTFNGYSYAIALTYRILKLFLPHITVYQVQRVVPVLCFSVVLLFLSLFVYSRFGILSASIVGLLLTLMPGIIERSSAGFSDRDAWCLMTGTLAVICYLWKEDSSRKSVRYLCTAVSGIFVFMGGMSWEGFGGFTLAIVVLELWRYLTTDTEERLSEYLLWVLLFVPTLYIFSPAYRSGSSWASYASVFVLLPPLVMLLLRSLRYFLTCKTHALSKFFTDQLSSRALSLVCCAFCLLISLTLIFLARDTFTEGILPFSSAAIMKTVGELQSPPDSFWYGRYGHVLLIACLSLSVGCIRIWGKKAIFLAATLAFFTAATFLRQYLYRILSPVICEYLFYGAVAFTPIAALGVAVLRDQPVKHELTYVAFAFWLLLWLGLARDAVRYDFFIGVPVALFAALGIKHIATHSTKYINSKTAVKTYQRIHRFTKPAVTLGAIALLLFFEPPGTNIPSLAHRGYTVKIEPEHVFPGKDTPISNACNWIQEKLSTENVLAAPWSYGHMLNAVGNVKTIIDPDHFILHWIHLYENMLLTTDENEALTFLKTHKATHLLLTENSVLHGITQNTNEKTRGMIRLKPNTHIGSKHYRMVPTHKNTAIEFVEINFQHTDALATAKLENKKTVKLGYAKPHYSNDSNEDAHTQDDHEHPIATDKNGGLLHFFDKKTHQEAIHYLSPQRWNSLAIKLFYRNQHSEAFVPVYPQQQTDNTTVKIWEIHYPPDIQTDPKYLQKSPPNRDKQK